MSLTTQINLHHKKIIFLGILGLIFYRSPELFLYPRFWAEEATLYFKSIYENSFLEGLFFIPRYTAEYITLSVNIPLTLAAHFFPIEYAPTVSTYFSLLILLIPFGLILWGNSYIWDSTIKKILVCLIILLAPTSTEAEIWLNTINLQVYCGIISICILFEKIDSNDLSKIKKWFYRLLLLFCGLSGPYTMFLSPVFLLKAWHEKSRESFWHFGIILAASIIQSTLFFTIRYLNMINPAKISHFDLVKAPIYLFNHHIMTPILGIWVRLGANVEDFMVTGKLQGTLLLIVSLATVITIFIILYFLTKNRTSIYRIILLIAFLSVSLLTSYASMHGVPAGRYAVIPGILFLLLLLDNIDFSKFNLKSLFLLILLGLSLVMGFKSFNTKEYWMAYVEGAPKWTDEIAQWKPNSDHLIASWPFPWLDDSWKFYLSNRELLNDLKEKIQAVDEINLVAQEQEVETVININGLPIDFHLVFVAHVTGAVQAYEANLIFLGKDDEFYGQYSINQALNQQTLAILAFYSVDRRTQPHKKMLIKYQNVKKIVVRLKSNSLTSLKMTELKIIAQKMSVF